MAQNTRLYRFGKHQEADWITEVFKRHVGRSARIRQESAEILLATLGIPDELTKANIDLWRQGNYFALVSWVGHLLPEGTSQLYSISDPTQNPITWTIKSQIRGI